MKPLSFLFATLLLFSACSDDSAPGQDSASEIGASVADLDASDASPVADDQNIPVQDALTPQSDLGPRTAGDPTELVNFGTNPGELTMWEVVPTNMPPKRPLVVVLHGCSSQDMKSYNAQTGWGELAAKNGFYVLYPQTDGANNLQSCFNWFQLSDAVRGQGEAASIKQGVDTMLKRHDIDPTKIFVSGFSAGAAMSAVMLANYPDVFAGGGIIAGVPFGCATDLLAAVSCMLSGEDNSPETWRDKVRAATSYDGPFPRVAIFHGTSDAIVNFSNFNESIEQWTAVHGTDQIPDRTEKLGDTDIMAYQVDGKDVVLGLRIDGFSHLYPERSPSAPEVLTAFWGI